MTVSGVVSMRSIRSEFKTNGDPESRVNRIMLVTILGGFGETSRPWPVSLTFGSGGRDLSGVPWSDRPPDRGAQGSGGRGPGLRGIGSPGGPGTVVRVSA